MGGAFNLHGTTVAGNVTHGDGGGIFALGPGSLADSTISGNHAGGYGGGVVVSSFYSVALRLRGVTLTRNVSDADRRGVGDGGGLFRDSRDSGGVDVANSIIADNFNGGGGAPGPDCGGQPLTSSGYNLIGTYYGCFVVGDTTGNITGDAMLGPLQDNGGPTKTHVPLPGSPALDAGNPAPPGSGGGACDLTDQRGVTRPLGARCDIGATESGCGNHVVEPGEQCDDGNVVTGDGCDANCTVTACGNGITGPGEGCDDGASNGVDRCCSATCQLIDADGDGRCDRDDPCTGTRPISAPRGLRIHTPGFGNDRFTMGGDVLLPFPFDPVLDPLVRGLRFVVSGADGTVVLDEQISGRDHWTVNSAGTRWVYAPHVGRGIVRATVRKKSSSVPGLLRFSVRGRGLYLPVSSAMLPLHATVVFDTPSADGGQCADATLACTLNLATGIISCG